eukprot:5906893-Amphidinium_carterae.1
MLQGGHNGPRPAWFMEEACKFLCENFCFTLQGDDVQKRMIQFGPTALRLQGFEFDFSSTNRPPPSIRTGTMLLPTPGLTSEPSCPSMPAEDFWDADTPGSARPEPLL